MATTLWRGFLTMTYDLQIFRAPRSTSCKPVARAENATNEQVLTRRGPAPGSLIKDLGQTLSDVTSVLVYPTFTLTWNPSRKTNIPLFLPAAEAVEVLPAFLFKYREPRLFSPPLRVVVSAWMLLIRVYRDYLRTAIGIISSTMPQWDSDTTLRLARLPRSLYHQHAGGQMVRGDWLRSGAAYEWARVQGKANITKPKPRLA